MTSRLASVSAAFSQFTNGGAWRLFFPFWKAEVGTTSIVRFLPDGDEDNPMAFLVENLTHDLYVDGKREKVGCLRMYNQPCCVCERSAEHYDKTSANHDRKRGLALYRKRTYIGQVLIRSTPVPHDQDQPVKLIEIGTKLFEVIRKEFQSGDLEEAPFELVGGCDFHIVKRQRGQHPDYSASRFTRKPYDVGDAEAGPLELFRLADYRAAPVAVTELQGMLEADTAGGSHKRRPATESQEEEPTLEAESPPLPPPVESKVSQLRRQVEERRRAAREQQS